MRVFDWGSQSTPSRTIFPPAAGQKNLSNCDLNYKTRAGLLVLLVQISKGATAMIGPLRTRKARALVIASSLAGAAVLLIVIAAPKPISVAALGSEWQCSKTAFVLTTCRQAEPMLASSVTQ
jgi:hypothetical protein